MPRFDLATADPFRGSLAVASGLVSEKQLRGPAVVRLHPDVYAGALREIDLRMRVLALDEWGHRRGIVAGPLAALSWKAECPWNDAELLLGTSRRVCPRDVRVRVDHLPANEIAHRFGVAMTTPLRTAFDLARREPLVEAVAAVDALAFRCRFGVDELLAVAEAHPGARGLVQVRRVAALMDRRAQSCMETRMRLVFVLRGLPAPVPQYHVSLPGGGYRLLDLAWPDVPPGRRKLGVEYDGPEHRTITGQNRDHFRDADLDDLGWELLHVPAAPVLDQRAADRLAGRVARRIR